MQPSSIFVATVPESCRRVWSIPITAIDAGWRLLRGIWHGEGWLAHASDAGILAIMFAVCLAVSTRVFRWE